MLHELEFADVHGLVDAYELVAELGSVQGCEIDLDRLQLRFVARFPLAEPTRAALNRAQGLVGARCWPTPPPVFDFAKAVAVVPASAQSAIDSSTSMTGMPSSTG
jgi:hypothetical protein